MPAICPLCEIGTLSSAVVDETITYGGKRLVVPGIAVSRCDNCGEELVLPDQARSNERIFADAKRAKEGLLTSSEIIHWRTQLGVTQAAAAKLLGGGVNAFSKYERGEVVQARSMDILMRVTLECDEARAFVFTQAGLSPPRRKSSWSLVVEAGAHAMFGGVRSAEVMGLAANDAISGWSDVTGERYAFG